MRKSHFRKPVLADVYALSSDGTRLYLGTTRIHGKKNRFYTRIHTALLAGRSYPVLQVAVPETFSRKHGEKPLCIWFKSSTFHTKVQKQLAFLAV